MNNTTETIRRVSLELTGKPGVEVAYIDYGSGWLPCDDIEMTQKGATGFIFLILRGCGRVDSETYTYQFITPDRLQEHIKKVLDNNSYVDLRKMVVLPELTRLNIEAAILAMRYNDLTYLSKVIP
jgi:hypothetical protein